VSMVDALSFGFRFVARRPALRGVLYRYGAVCSQQVVAGDGG
jgi:hypothetical protein